MTRVDAAIKAIELYDQLHKLFDTTPDFGDGDAIAEFHLAITQFAGIYNILMHERFNLERIKLGRI